jgi:transposase
MKEVAKKYFRTEGYVGQLVKRVRENRKLLHEMSEKRDQAIATEETIQDVIKELLDENTFIENLEQVAEEVLIRYNLKVNKQKVRLQMKELGLSWKKVKQVAIQSNSVRCLVLRQRWAISFLEMDLKSKNWINIDETWLGMADFRKMYWRPMDRNWSVKEKSITPRLSLITAVDRIGNVWISLTQSNSNKSMMGVFMEHFCRKMDH